MMLVEHSFVQLRNLWVRSFSLVVGSFIHRVVGFFTCIWHECQFLFV